MDFNAQTDPCTAPQYPSMRHCIRCGKVLSGKKVKFCTYDSPDSCHRLYWSEARKAGIKVRNNEERERNLYLFGRHPIAENERLRMLVEAAKRIIHS